MPDSEQPQPSFEIINARFAWYVGGAAVFLSLFVSLAAAPCLGLGMLGLACARPAWQHRGEGWIIWLVIGTLLGLIGFGGIFALVFAL